MTANNFLRIIKYLFMLPAFFLIVFGAVPEANAKVTTTSGNLKITHDDPLFSVTNAAPGESFFSDMTVENLGGADRKFQFELNITTNPKALAKRLFLEVGFLDEAGKYYCEYGCGENKDLETLDGSEFVVKTIPGNSSKDLRFALTFDPNAGNEFQNANMAFDIKLGYEGDGGNGGGNGAAAGGAGPVMGFFAGVPGVPGIAGAATEGESAPAGEGEVKGEQTPEEGEVEGISVTTCEGWPLWVWVLALVAYFTAFLWRSFEKFREQIEKREIRWKWQAVLAIAAFLFWYFFDFCREYWWFVIIALVGGAAVYLAYLYFFKKGVRETGEQIEKEPGQSPPKNPTQ